MATILPLTRIPNIYVESDLSQARIVGGNQPHNCLLVGYKLAAGTATEGQPVKVTSEGNARTLFGAGSQLHRMAKRYLSYRFGAPQLWALPMAEAAGGAKATGQLSITGTATEAGTLNVYIGLDFKAIPVAEGDTGTQIAAKIVAEFTKNVEKRFDIAVDGVVDTQVNLTANHKGSYGNDIKVRINWLNGEVNPAGLTVGVTEFSGGAGEVDYTNFSNNLGEDYYNYMAFADAVAAAINSIGNTLTSRATATYMQHSIAITGKTTTATAFTTFMSTINQPRVVVHANDGKQMPNDERAAYNMAMIAYRKTVHPAWGLSEQLIPEDLPAPKSARFEREDRESILADGGSCDRVVNEQVYTDLFRTSATTDSQGNETLIYDDLTILTGASYATWFFRQRLERFQNAVTFDENLPPPVNGAVRFANATVLKSEMQEAGRDLAGDAIIEDLQRFNDSVNVLKDVSGRRFNITAKINYSNAVYFIALSLQAEI